MNSAAASVPDALPAAEDDDAPGGILAVIAWAKALVKKTPGSAYFFLLSLVIMLIALELARRRLVRKRHKEALAREFPGPEPEGDTEWNQSYR